MKLKGYIFTIVRYSLFPICFITFLIFLVFAFHRCPFRSPRFLIFLHNKALNSTNETTATSSLTNIIVVSHYRENLDWLDLLIGEQIPHIVYTRSSDQLTRHNILINKGREAIAYLRYIVGHYSNLPSSIAFVHGHRTSWHQKDPSDIVVALRALQWHKYNYMPLTSFMTKAIFQLHTGDLQATANYELWRDVFENELGPPPENGTKAPWCASFVFKREAILAHPKTFYSKISEYISTTPYTDNLTSRTLEYTWHIIFGQPAHINYRTCDIFVCNFSGNASVQLAEKIQ